MRAYLDIDAARRPNRWRTANHERLLIEFVCHIKGQNHFSKPHRAVRLRDRDITDEHVRTWAQVRRIVMETEFDPDWDRQTPMPPIFLLADRFDANAFISTREYESALRDLQSFVGARVAITKGNDPIAYTP